MLYGNAYCRHTEKPGGRLRSARRRCNSKDDLPDRAAYTPGVAEPCLKIAGTIRLSYKYTRRHNLVVVITDGTAVLALAIFGLIAGMLAA